MKIITPLLKKTSEVLKSILLIASFLINGLAEDGFAIQGYETSDGKCYAYSWTKGNQVICAPRGVGHYGSLFLNNDGRLGWGIGAFLGYGAHCQINYQIYGSFQSYVWMPGAKVWNTLYPPSYSISVREIVNHPCANILDQPIEQAFPEYGKFLDFFQSRGIPENQTPTQYWPDGPPPGCGDLQAKSNYGPPPCDSGQCCR